MDGPIAHFFIFSSALVALLISLGQAVQKNKGFVDYIYAVSFGGLSVWFLMLSLVATGVFDDSATAWYLRMFCVPVAFMVSPLMTLRYRWIISSELGFRKRYIFPFLPAILSLLVLVYLVAAGMVPYSPDYSITMPVMSGEFGVLPLQVQWVYILMVLPSVYLLMLMLPVLVTMVPYAMSSPQKGKPNTSRAGFVFASLIAGCNILAVAGFLYSMELLRFAIIAANCSMCGVYLVTQRHPDYNRLLKSLSRKRQYERSVTRGLDVNTIVNRLYELMDDEKVFVDEDLSLADLAGELSVSSHQLSEILNCKIKKNFSTFINEYRVNEAKCLMLEEPDRSLLSVGTAVGFNSYSTFNSVFLRYEGISPGRYRKQAAKR